MSDASSVGCLLGERKIGRPKNFVQGGSACDDAEMQGEPEYVEDLGSLIGVRLAIAYLDSRSELTRRIIVIQKVSQGASCFHLHAYCELREMIRTFRVDRIIEVIDLRTGEVHENPRELLSDLLLVANATAPHRPKGEAARADPTERLIAESEHGLTVLLYFAQSDQKLRRGERAIIWKYLEWQQFRCSIEGRVARRPLNAWMDTLLPDTDQLAISLGRLLDSERIHSHYVLARVPDIVMADGQADAEEKRRLRGFLDYMEKCEAE